MAEGYAESLLTAVRRFAESQPEAPAVVGGETTLTYAALDAESDRISAALAERCGVQRRDIAAVHLPNSLPFPVVLLGLLKAGATALLLDPLLTPHEVSAAVRFCGAAPIIRETDSPSAGDMGAPVVTVGALWESSPSEPVPGRQPAAPYPDQPAVLLLTSGTTGEPKIVPITHAGIAANARALNETLGFSSDSRSLIVLPLAHASALVSQLATHLLLGASVVLVPNFMSLAMKLRGSPTDIGASDTSLAPSMVRSLVERGLMDGLTRMGIRVVQVVGAPLPSRHYREAMSAAPELELVKCYGLTEATCRVTCLRAADATPETLESSGRPLPRIEVHVEGQQGEGEIWVKGPSVAEAYWGNAGASAEAFVDGYLRTGDLGYVNNEGFLFIRGRRKELISVGSNNVLPREVEEAILDHPAVAEAAAVGLPDETMGECVGVAVVARERLSVADLQDFCGRRLAVFKLPSTWVQLPDLPRTGRGKIDYPKLREILLRR